MPGVRSIAQQVRQFIIENFLYGQERAFGDDASLLDEGIVDSTGVLQLVTFLEESYGIAVDDEDLIPENLDSVNSVAAYICRKTNVPAEIASTKAQSVRGQI